MEILKCENITKVYGSGDSQVVALNKVNLSVQKGEFVAIVGASGSGKSTLLHILGNVDKPTEGKVLVEGTDISTMNLTQSAIFRRRKVGLVYQFYNLIPTLTVRNNILMPLLLDKREPNQELFDQIIQSLGIEDKGVILDNGEPIRCYRLDYSDDDEILSAWAVHLRRHYISDEELAKTCEELELSSEEYLKKFIIPQRVKDKMAGTARSNGISEILFSDLLEFIYGFEVPRCRIGNLNKTEKQIVTIIAEKR